MATIESVKKHMDAALEAVRREFATVRTGKATPTLLDTVRVDAYGSKLPLNQVATVSTPEASLLLIQPYDASVLAKIERAILEAGMSLNPVNDGKVIRIPIPPLNEERRREYVRLLHTMAEEGRISIRHARREGNESVKQNMKDHEVSDDEGHKRQEQIQKLTDEYIGKIDALVAAKEQEILKV
ncbi:MAG: ribosome recycling factor [Gemmatimonadetes bacterium]|nr:ribosome recycling factor [Gemmatimonadota bacterium]